MNATAAEASASGPRYMTTVHRGQRSLIDLITRMSQTLHGVGIDPTDYVLQSVGLAPLTQEEYMWIERYLEPEIDHLLLRVS